MERARGKCIILALPPANPCGAKAEAQRIFAEKKATKTAFPAYLIKGEQTNRKNRRLSLALHRSVGAGSSVHIGRKTAVAMVTVPEEAA
jgi:hypothetical protein